MVKGLYQSANALYFKQKNLEIVSGNLANVNTKGYKRESPFAELMSRFDNDEVRQTSYTDFSSGVISKTDNPMDFAIDGNAYFVIETDRGLELTKNGKFKIDQEGYVVTDDGHKLIGQGGYVNLGLDWQKNIQEFVVDVNGEVRINKNNVGRLLIATIDDPKMVERREGLNFAMKDNNIKQADEKYYKVLQGHLEDSNVNPITEMQQLIEIDKGFQSIQKVINTLDDSLDKANQAGKL
ncbi:MAG TPA: flagellar hook-basal body protein [Ignavibacteriales bacterium]|nr:flagellar hook-basal body protein [Ignavibacteriales bacterium]HOL80719.1 flagellar hook-basal body protein [Ignavibacteriales bacterium]HOM64406.1 flagellar hook-basal body protein [Ignavibacteriales bacterium]HPD67194.1 flagellar hook-basal body protein [Ignavibacteriales bacterium]HPP32948.1 flagellar hook-basal body protein [Ignavibacteriales bacterium]